MLPGAGEVSAVRRFEQYLANRSYFYNMERRFPASPFWKRRQEALPSLPAMSIDATGSGRAAMDG